MNVAVSVGFAFSAIMAACLFVLWFGSTVVIDEHEERLLTLEKRWTAAFGGPEPADDSPEAMSEDVGDDRAEAGETTNTQVSNDVSPDASTDEFPAIPATVPDGIAIQVQTALIEQRPSPVPRDVEMVERTVNIGGTLQTFRIPASREEAS